MLYQEGSSFGTNLLMFGSQALWFPACGATVLSGLLIADKSTPGSRCQLLFHDLELLRFLNLPKPRALCLLGMSFTARTRSPGLPPVRGGIKKCFHFLKGCIYFCAETMCEKPNLLCSQFQLNWSNVFLEIFKCCGPHWVQGSSWAKYFYFKLLKLGWSLLSTKS